MKPNLNTTVKSFDVSIEKSANEIKLTAEACQALCEKAGVKYLEGYESQVFQFVLTSTKVDRQNEVVIPSGVDFKNYLANPVVLAFHNSYSFPVGASLKVWYDKATDTLKGWILLLDERVDESGASETVLAMVKNGILRTGSIGFISKARHEPSAEEILKYGFDESNRWSRGCIHDKSELIEFSIVPIPANSDAKTEVLSKAFALNLTDKQKSFLGKLENETVLSPTANIGGGDSDSSILPNDINNSFEKEKNSDYIKPKMTELLINVKKSELASTSFQEDLAFYKSLNSDDVKVILNVQDETEIPAVTEKAGASVSAKNKTLIKMAIEACKKACEHLSPLAGEDDNEGEDSMPELKNLDSQIETLNKAFQALK